MCCDSPLYHRLRQPVGLSRRIGHRAHQFFNKSGTTNYRNRHRRPNRYHYRHRLIQPSAGTATGWYSHRHPVRVDRKEPEFEHPSGRKYSTPLRVLSTFFQVAFLSPMALYQAVHQWATICHCQTRNCATVPPTGRSYNDRSINR